jgi:hypothetical protein
MDVTLAGMFIEVSAEQPLNALFPIEVNVDGNVTDVIVVQPLNQFTPTVVIPLLMTTDLIDLLVLNVSS